MCVAGFISSSVHVTVVAPVARPPLTYHNISRVAGTWHSDPSFRPGHRPSCLAPHRLRLQRTPPCRSSPGSVCWHRSWSTAFSSGTKESCGRGNTRKHSQLSSGATLYMSHARNKKHSFKYNCIYCQVISHLSKKGPQEQKGSCKRKLQMFLLVSDDTLNTNIHQWVCYCVTKELFVPWTHLINNPSVQATRQKEGSLKFFSIIRPNRVHHVLRGWFVGHHYQVSQCDTHQRRPFQPLSSNTSTLSKFTGPRRWFVLVWLQSYPLHSTPEVNKTINSIARVIQRLRTFLKRRL